jgi:amidophosphoribosyltransferase
MCGFVGIIGVEHAAPLLYSALQSIQHRGQDAAGIGTLHQGRFLLQKDLGLVSQALPASRIESMPGTSGIGHVRYPTVGVGDREDAQPFITRRPGILMAHNGNLTNVVELEEDLRDWGLHVQSRCDSEPILLVLADELTRLRPSKHTEEDLVKAVSQLMKRLRGSYSVGAVLQVDGEETLVGFRDPHGFRPGVYGRRADGAWLIASESVALDALGFELVDVLPPGALILLRKGQEPIIHEVEKAERYPCVFERIYFARPDSLMEGGRVYSVRWAMGEKLADEWAKRGLNADVVVPVPDTSRPAAAAIAERLGLPFREGFIKNRYSGRTFIMPDQRARDAALRLKLNPIREVFEGKRVLLVDDSVVRGSTMRRIVHMIRTLNPSEVHLGIFSPPVRHPCFYGIDMPSSEELIAGSIKDNDVLEGALKERFQCDSVSYLTLDGMSEVTGEKVCKACFTGKYVVDVSEKERSFIRQDRRP